LQFGRDAATAAYVLHVRSPRSIYIYFILNLLILSRQRSEKQT